jgi:hypothetical protein
MNGPDLTQVPAGMSTPIDGSLTSHYAPGEERPLAAYALITGTYATVVAGSMLALRLRGRELSTRPPLQDLILIGVASHKLSRLIAKDKVTSFLRAPFTQYQEPGRPGEVEERPYGHGLRLAAGELLVCPYCLAQWAATGLTLGLVGAPRFTRWFSSALAAHTIADFLQVAYRAAEDQL